MTVPPFPTRQSRGGGAQTTCSHVQGNSYYPGYPTIQSPVKKMFGGVLTFREPHVSPQVGLSSSSESEEQYIHYKSRFCCALQGT